MRTINDKKLTIMGCSIVQTMCIFISAAFALQEPAPSIYIDALGAIGYLAIAAILEWIKHKFIQYKYEEENEDTQD